MIIGHPLKTKDHDQQEVLQLNNCDVERVDKAKSLGVIIDEKLNWEEWFRHTKGNMRGGLEGLNRLQNVIPQSELCSINYALIESHLCYTNVITIVAL